MAYCAESAVSN